MYYLYTMNKLVEPNQNYIKRIENSWNLLNCPKHMLNHDLDCIYRQFVTTHTKDFVIQTIANHLKHYGITEPVPKATEFVEWRHQLTTPEFNKININSYIVNGTPIHIDKKNDSISAWIESHTTYYPAIYGGGVNYVPTYPFLYSHLN